MTRPIYAAIIAILCALFSWIYWETKAPPRPVVRKPVQTAIRSGPPRNEPYIVPRKWKRWKKPEAKDCLQRKDPDCGGVIYSLEEWEKWMNKHRMERGIKGGGT